MRESEDQMSSSGDLFVTSGNSNTWRRWRWAAPAALLSTLLSVYPLIHMRLTKGSDWHGSFAYLQPDELPYAAYLNALVSGRSRRNNPYTGEQDRADAPLAESSYSIQFAPAYAAAALARVFGLSTSATFAVLMVIAAFSSALVLFWLILSVTGNEHLAAVGALVVICLGGVLTLWGFLQILRGFPPDFTHFRFSRRYVPALVFPVLFAFCGLVWQILTARRAASWIAVLMASAAFTVLVFSYFFYWTAALAWLACVGLIWLLGKPDGWLRSLKLLGVLFILAGVSLLPYSWLLNKRARDQDVANLLAHTHAPNFLRVPLLASGALLILLILCHRYGFLRFRDRSTLFVMSFLLLPFLLFNQQIVTGLSLQPAHYEVFVANYGVLLALALSAGIVFRNPGSTARKYFNVSLLAVAFVAVGWGAFEVSRSAAKYTPAFLTRDDATPAAMRLARLADDQSNEPAPGASIVLATDPVVADYLPTVAPQPQFWAQHMYVFAGVTAAQDRKRLLQFLYYTGVHFEGIDADQFAKLDPQRKMYFTALMGRSRTDRSLTSIWKPIGPEEYENAQRTYTDFVSTFNRDQASHPTLSYVLTSNEQPIDFSRLDQWYERDNGERIGKFVLYRVKLRAAP
jgi:hypothetical protein